MNISMLDQHRPNVVFRNKKRHQAIMHCLFMGVIAYVLTNTVLGAS